MPSEKTVASPMAGPLTIRAFQPADEPAVIELWMACGLTRPWNDPRLDIARKLAWQPAGFFVGESAGRIVVTAMVGYDGHRGWVNYLAVRPGCRQQGLGRRMMAHAEQWLLSVGCPKLNLQVRHGNQEARDFYAALGYQVDAADAMGKRLIVDTPPA